MFEIVNTATSVVVLFHGVSVKCVGMNCGKRFIWRLTGIEGLNWGVQEIPDDEKKTVEIVPATALPKAPLKM